MILTTEQDGDSLEVRIAERVGRAKIEFFVNASVYKNKTKITYVNSDGKEWVLLQIEEDGRITIDTPTLVE